jgi:hypothetical protein
MGSHDEEDMAALEAFLYGLSSPSFGKVTPRSTKREDEGLGELTVLDVRRLQARRKADGNRGISFLDHNGAVLSPAL